MTKMKNNLILILGEHQDAHVISVQNKLDQLNQQFLTLNINSLAKGGVIFSATNNSVVVLGPNNTELELANSKSIWARGIVPYHVSRDKLNESQTKYLQNQWLELLYGINQYLKDKYWVSDPDKMKSAGNKLQQIAMAKKYFNVPDTVITNLPNVALDFCQMHHGEVVLKTLTSGGFLDNSGTPLVIPTTRIKQETIDTGFKGLEQTPIILQKRIEHSIELRTFVIGEATYSVSLKMQHTEDSDDIRDVDPNNITYDVYKTERDYDERCVSFVKRFGLKYAALDVIKSKNNMLWFLDLNPMGQFLVYEEKTGIDISGNIAILLARGRREH